MKGRRVRLLIKVKLCLFPDKNQPDSLSEEELNEIWSGEIILISKREGLLTSFKEFDIKWFIPALLKYKKFFGEVILISFILQLFALVTPLFFQVVMDKVLVHRGFTTLDVLAFGFVCIAVFDAILGGLQNYVFSHTTNRVDVELGARLFNHLVSLPLSYFESRQVGQSVARVQYLELEQQRVEQQHDLIGAKASNSRLIAQLDELKQQRNTFIAQTRSDNLQQLLQADREYLSLTEELNKAKDLNKKQILTSPVDGVVQELAVHTVGGVVTEAQPLMKIVPENQQLEVEAWLENKDIGFIYPEQSAEVKIHTFPFTKYGIIDGKVETISADATVDEQRGLIYKAKILLEKSSLKVDGRNVQLVPGMG
ncbi:MAG: HlyD family type I secretion periplasmic adaptor subunit [Amphritea sp.]|nr:HlyD family type I secretion periplasmic adaptor subunit [Amphritea sp.]